MLLKDFKVNKHLTYHLLAFIRARVAEASNCRELVYIPGKSGISCVDMSGCNVEFN